MRHHHQFFVRNMDKQSEITTIDDSIPHVVQPATSPRRSCDALLSKNMAAITLIRACHTAQTASFCMILISLGSSLWVLLQRSEQELCAVTQWGVCVLLSLLSVHGVVAVMSVCMIFTGVQQHATQPHMAHVSALPRRLLIPLYTMVTIGCVGSLAALLCVWLGVLFCT